MAGESALFFSFFFSARPGVDLLISVCALFTIIRIFQSSIPFIFWPGTCSENPRDPSISTSLRRGRARRLYLLI